MTPLLSKRNSLLLTSTHAIFIFALTVLFITAFSVQAKTATPDISIQQAKILAVEEHNKDWFTQGLYHDEDSVYISSGLYGRSALIKQSKTPTLKQQSYRLNKRYFAEGLTIIGDTLYLLTWKENTLLLFDKNTLKLSGKKRYQGEAWGLTHTPKTTSPAELIMSNGSDTLTFRDPETFNIKRQLKVKNVDLINELEYVNGIIWANRWYDNHLYGIDSKTGQVLAKVDLLPLRKKATIVNNKNVVNGVSYDKKRKGLWVTGKYWSKRFLIKMPKIQKNEL